MAQKTSRRPPRWLKIIVGVVALVLIVVGLALAIVIFWPDVAAQNIDRLRDVIGDAPVAQLEEAVLSIKDRTQQLEYRAGLVKPAAPWAPSQPQAVAQQPTATLARVNPVSTYTATSNIIASNTAAPASTISTATPFPPSGVITATTALYANNPTATPVQTANHLSTWQLLPVSPLGNLAGEGQWLPYMYAATGKSTVAYRTYLQVDPQRPYSIAAVVAFDLRATRLHFVLGTIEPIPDSPQPNRTGAIPAGDLRPGILLATFNGGFKARHGYYGAMANGLIALPATDGLATVAMYADGTVRIGEWGTEIQDSPEMVAWRQNGKLLIHNGQINPATLQATEHWGRTITGQTITWRSALGLSSDARTLYYVVGLQLDAPTLARVMAQVGAAQALQLDVNEYWVHFAAIRRYGSGLSAEPLLDAMNLQADRYLRSWSRDFFYVTAAGRQ